jgi:BON domain
MARTDPKAVLVTVRHGVVTLTGRVQLEPGSGDDLVPLALHLIWDIDGVVDVVNWLDATKAPKQASTA